MARIWTDEQREAQAERCRQNQPWKQSTGPKSVAGKRKVSLNSCKPASWYMDDALIAAAYERLYEHSDEDGYLELCRQAKLIRRRLYRKLAKQPSKIKPWKPTSQE